ncbi:hypothetical protein SNEBB_000876 [Seison nebaliae]|nr:hypothetical protein SNEBB_000876 [Seison nebaliae]
MNGSRSVKVVASCMKRTIVNFQKNLSTISNRTNNVIQDNELDLFRKFSTTILNAKTIGKIADARYAYWGEPKTNGNKEKEFGKAQSPIDIPLTDLIAIEGTSTNAIHLEWSKSPFTSFKNTGHGIQVDVNPDNPSYVFGGPLSHKYELVQFHAHWSKNKDGCEHTVNGKRYPVEFHFVYYNKQLYRSFMEAVMGSTHHDGLCVIGVFGELHDEKNCSSAEKETFRTWAKIGEKNTPEAKNSYIANEAELKAIKFPELLTKNATNYYSYDGGLTTPPFSECVRWIVLKEPFKIPMDVQSQLIKIIESNFRPVQERFDRPIFLFESK